MTWRITRVSQTEVHRDVPVLLAVAGLAAGAAVVTWERFVLIPVVCLLVLVLAGAQATWVLTDAGV